VKVQKSERRTKSIIVIVGCRGPKPHFNSHSITGMSFDFGKNEVKKHLEKDDEELWHSLDDLQSKFLLSSAIGCNGENSSTSAALKFLDFIKVSRTSTNVGMFEFLKDKLEELIINMDDAKLLQILQETFHLITINELKLIPISIIKRLQNIPVNYLNLLAEKNTLSVVL
jgi:hypothetical protein